jgi:hypothetical protein
MKNARNRLKIFSLNGNVVVQLLAIGALLCLLGTSQNASATNYFNWGVESLKVDYGVNGPGTLTVSPFGATTRDCTVAHTGSCSSKLVVKGDDSNNQGLGWDMIQQNPPYPWNFVGAPSVYYRWWMRIMPGFSWGTGANGGHALTKTMRTVKSNGTQAWTEYMSGTYFDLGGCDVTVGCLTNTGGATGSGPPTIPIPYNIAGKADGVWHEYIIRVKPNTNGNCTAGTNCDGQFQAWVDGVSVGQNIKFKLIDSAHDGPWVESAMGSWMVRPYFQLGGTSSDGGTIYLDDFSTDDVYNSSIQGGQTTLSAPTNLRVQ